MKNIYATYRKILSKDGIPADATEIQAIKKPKKTENMAELRSFLGLATYLGRYGWFHTKAFKESKKLGMGWSWNLHL